MDILNSYNKQEMPTRYELNHQLYQVKQMLHSGESHQMIAQLLNMSTRTFYNRLKAIKKAEKNGEAIKLPLPEDEEPKKKQEYKTLKDISTKGVLEHAIKLAGKDRYFNADKFIIIAPGGSGKSTLAMNLAIFVVKHYNNILIITPSTEDTCMNALIEWADEAGMNTLITSIDKDGNLAIPEKISKTLFIIDDYYSAQNQPIVIKKLLEELWVRGRHQENSMMYIAHSNRNIPHVIKIGCNGLFINQGYKEIEGTLDVIPEDNDIHQFWMCNQYDNPTQINKVVFGSLPHKQAIINKLKMKRIKKKKGDNSKFGGTGLDLPNTEIKEIILKGEIKAGNTSAVKSLKNNENGIKMLQMNNQFSQSTGNLQPIIKRVSLAC